MLVEASSRAPANVSRVRLFMGCSLGLARTGSVRVAVNIFDRAETQCQLEGPTLDEATPTALYSFRRGRMRTRFFGVIAAAVLIGGAVMLHRTQKHERRIATATVLHSSLPSASMAKAALNFTRRHFEWVNVPYGSSGVRAFVVYPMRSDKAPVVVVTEHDGSASTWSRAVADQLAAEGYIAVVPDVLSGAAANGGDADSFPNDAAIAMAVDRLGSAEVARRANAARDFAVT